MGETRAKCTPGPWDAHGEDEIMAGGWDKHVATAWNNDKIEPGEATANAAAIAAVPDLLEAGEAILAANDNDGFVSNAEIAKLRAAVAKARGGA